MILTITSVTRNQWKKVGIVALWVVLTNAVGILTAWLTAKPEFLAIGPALNVFGKAVQQIFQNEEDQALGQLPANMQPPADKVIATVDNEVLKAEAKIADPVVFTPTDKIQPPTEPIVPPNTTPPNIGSTPNS